jgi:hypothetical protein
MTVRELRVVSCEPLQNESSSSWCHFLKEIFCWHIHSRPVRHQDELDELATAARLKGQCLEPWDVPVLVIGLLAGLVGKPWQVQVIRRVRRWSIATPPRACSSFPAYLYLTCSTTWQVAHCSGRGMWHTCRRVAFGEAASTRRPRGDLKVPAPSCTTSLLPH